MLFIINPKKSKED